MRYLVGVDGSSGGFEAVRFIGRASNPDTDAIFLYYSPPRLHLTGGKTPDPEILARVEQSLFDAVFDEARARLSEAWREKARTIVGCQQARQGLLVAADEQRADLIVLGARGVGPIREMLLGSTARGVVHAATLPVLVVRPRKDRGPDEPLRVLLACDGSAESQRAGAMLGQFKWPPETVGRAMRVVESLLVGHVPEWLQQQARDSDNEAMAKAWYEEHEAERQRTIDQLTEKCRDLHAAFREQSPIVVEGHPAEQILRVIEEEKPDLVALGARGLGVVGRLLLGSTSEKVLTHAACSVLVVPHHDTP